MIFRRAEVRDTRASADRADDASALDSDSGVRKPSFRFWVVDAAPLVISSGGLPPSLPRSLWIYNAARSKKRTVSACTLAGEGPRGGSTQYRA